MYISLHLYVYIHAHTHTYIHILHTHIYIDTNTYAHICVHTKYYIEFRVLCVSVDVCKINVRVIISLSTIPVIKYHDALDQ